jgi:DNA-binding NtrC family response regulator
MQRRCRGGSVERAENRMTPRRRILLVDDDPMILLVFRDTLMELGNAYEIASTTTGLDALDEVEKEPVDLVITDLNIPDLGGVELTEAIRELSADTTVVWITAYGCHTVSADATRLGVHRCYDKPLEVDEILALAREALGGEPAAEKSQQ